MVQFDTRIPFFGPRRTQIFLQDDFLTGTATSGSIGTLGWSSSGTITSLVSTTNQPGKYRIDTSSVSGTHARINGLTSALIDPSLYTSLFWRAIITQVDANTQVRIGAANGVSAVTPNDGIYFEKLDADSNWFCVTRASSSQTRTDTGVAVDTSIHNFWWVRGTSSVTFYIDGIPKATHTATIPTIFIGPFLYIINSAAASKTMDVDYFSLIQTGLVR